MIHAAQVREISREVLMQLSPDAPTWLQAEASKWTGVNHQPTGWGVQDRGCTAWLPEDFPPTFSSWTSSGNLRTLTSSLQRLQRSLHQRTHKSCISVNAGTERSVVLNDLKQQGRTLRVWRTWNGLLTHTGQPMTTRAGCRQTQSIGYGNQTIERLQSLYDKYENARGAGSL